MFAPLLLAPSSADGHGYSRCPKAASLDVDILSARWRLAHCFCRITHTGRLVYWSRRRAVAVDGGPGAPRVCRDAAIANIGRPRIDRVGYGVDLLGVAGAHRDGVGTLKVTVDLVMTGKPVTSPEQQGREQSQISHGHLSLL